MKHKANIAKYQQLEITGEKTMSIYSTFHFSEDFQKKKTPKNPYHLCSVNAILETNLTEGTVRSWGMHIFI